MSFLSRLFKSKEPETLERKLVALEMQAPDELLVTATNGSNEALRIAATKRLPYSETLLQLAAESPSNGISITARKRIGELLDTGQVSMITLGQNIHDQSTLLMFCGYSSDAGLALIEQISDEELLLEVALDGPTTQIRQAAAQKIEGRRSLEALCKSSKQKDKSVYKIAKNKMAVFRAEKAEETKIAEQIDAACSQAEQLAKRDIDDIFHAKKQQIVNTWMSLSPHATAEAQDRYNTALDRCQAKLDELAEQQRLREQQESADRAAKHDVRSALEAMQQFLVRLYSQEVRTEGNGEELQQELEQKATQQEQALRDAESLGLNIEKEKSRAGELLSAAQNLLHRMQAYGPLEHLLAEMQRTTGDARQEVKDNIESLLQSARGLNEESVPEVITRGRKVVQNWAEELKEKAHQSSERLKDSKELLRKGNWAVSQGQVGRARAIFRDLEERIQRLDEIPAHIEGKAQELKESIQRLADWHAFAVDPKKQALVAEMKSLIGSDQHPADLAKKIQQLQDSWKELCKGGQNQNEELWEEFRSAAQQAYEPCKRYFEEQAQEREANADKRKLLLEQLQQYHDAYDWENADWKEVDKTLKISREAWQSYWPVPRKQIKQLQSAFDELMDKLYGQLHAEYARNVSKKEALVAQSKSLSDQADTPAAIESVKRMQAQWQSVGRCKRKDDQALWKAFRANCDAVFERRSQETEALKEERAIALEQAQTVLAKLEAMLVLKGDAFFVAKSALDELTTEFQAIGELPKEHSKNIAQRYNSALENIRQKTADERDAANRHMWQHVLHAADSIRRYERSVLLETDADNTKRDAETALQASIKWPGDAHELLEQRLNEAATVDQDKVEASLQMLRLLCIRSEIITGAETPESDKSERMSYQVTQLQHGLGQQQTATGQSMNDFVLEWIKAPAAPDADYQKLMQRFDRCWHVLEGPSDQKQKATEAE